MSLLSDMKNRLLKRDGHYTIDEDYEPDFDYDDYDDDAGVRVIPRNTLQETGSVRLTQRSSRMPRVSTAYDRVSSQAASPSFPRPSRAMGHSASLPPIGVNAYKPVDYGHDDDYLLSHEEEAPISPYTGEVRAFPRKTRCALQHFIPESYADVQQLCSYVKQGRSCALILDQVRPEIAKRILDFSYGLAMGIDGSIDRLGERCFVLLVNGAQVTSDDLHRLRREGHLAD